MQTSQARQLHVASVDSPSPSRRAASLGVLGMPGSQRESPGADDFDRTANLGPYALLARQTAERLSRLSYGALISRPLCLEEKYACRDSLNGRFRLTTRAWELTRGGSCVAEVRMVLIAGTTNEIINTWIFPHDAGCDPVFASELIAMANAPRLTFMDIQVPGLQDPFQGQVAACSEPVRQQFADLVIDELPPAWAIDATQGHFLFSRAGASQQFPRIQAGYLALLDRYLDLLADARMCEMRANDRTSAQQILHRYQHHHLQHSPGGTFLAKVFGQDWTDDFLNSFLFTLPSEPCHV